MVQIDRKPSPREKSNRQKNLDQIKERYSYARSIRENVHCSRTLSIYETKGEYILKYVDTITRYDNQYLNNNSIVEPLFTYNQYVEALNSLRHNCAFVLFAYKFNKDNCGLSVEDLKTISYDYPKSLLSSCVSTTKSNTLDINDLDEIITYTLETSKKIVEQLESNIDIIYLSTASPSFQEIHKKNQKLQGTLIANADKLIENIKNKKINFSGLKTAVKNQGSVNFVK